MKTDTISGILLAAAAAGTVVMMANHPSDAHAAGVGAVVHGSMILLLLVMGFGFFHFAHVVGFNHFNLLLAASRVGLTPVKTVSPTGVIFERGVGEAPEALAEKGRALTAAHFVGTSPGKQYLAYQRRKIAGRR